MYTWAQCITSPVFASGPDRRNVHTENNVYSTVVTFTTYMGHEGAYEDL